MHHRHLGRADLIITLLEIADLFSHIRIGDLAFCRSRIGYLLQQYIGTADKIVGCRADIALGGCKGLSVLAIPS